MIGHRRLIAWAVMRKWVYGAMATIGSLGLVLAILLASGVFTSGTSAQCRKAYGPAGDGPLFNVTATTIATAQDVAGFPVLMPDVPAAQLPNLSQTWVAQRTVALVFAQGKISITMARANYGNALKDFRRVIRKSTRRRSLATCRESRRW
jgi:hypothetical protein